MTKKKEIHPDVIDGVDELVEIADAKAKKAIKVETPEEREERLARAREEREQRKEEEEWREMMAPARREKAAKALWQMYYNGELIKQTIDYHGENGGIKQEVLFSHKSIYAI